MTLGLGDPDFATDYEEFATVSMDFGAYAMTRPTIDGPRRRTT